MKVQIKESVALNIKTPEQIAETLATILEMDRDEVYKK